MARWAIVDSDGMDLVVWGAGTTEAAAERDAKKWGLSKPTEHFRAVRVTPAEYNDIRINGGGRRPEITARGRRPARRTTGSKSTPTVSFRLGSDERARLDAYATKSGLTANEVARSATMAVVDADG